MFKVGVTGGIASGKTTVTRLFEALGVTVIDADLVAREVVEPGQPALAEIKQVFGDKIITTDGRLDRAALRKIIFSNSEKRGQLERILHPAIRQEMSRQALQASGRYCILSIPLLVENQLQNSVDRILVVDTSEQTQTTRLQIRDGSSAEEAGAMIAAQIDRQTRLEAADDVIENSGDIESLRRKVRALHDLYLSLAARPGQSI
ncbi:MAG: dephospho-CoA kinase [Gammaproteobacteria bacterium]|nr:dephospho-CoA kinase [Gammaproteobacteria bacterium]